MTQVVNGFWWGALLALGFFALGCGSESAEAEAGRAFSVELLYVDLNPRPEAFSKERRPAITNELEGARDDLACLQGVWAENDRDAVTEALRDTLPYSLALATDDFSATPADANLGPACSGNDLVGLESLLGCLAVQCSTSPGDWDGRQLPEDCLSGSHVCGAAFSKLGAVDPAQRCRGCFLRHRRAGATFAEIEQRCGSLPGDPLAHDGQHGILLLSKYPLSAPDLRILSSQGVRRAVLGAKVALPNGRPVSVWCASLGSEGDGRLPGDPFPGEPYPGAGAEPTIGWSSEHALQVQSLRATLAEQRATPLVLLGNLNASEAVSRNGSLVIASAAQALEDELEQDLDLARPAGFSEECTICPENPLLHFDAEPPAPAPTWLNRVYVGGSPRPKARTASRRYLGNVVSVVPFVTPRVKSSSGWVPVAPQYGFRVELSVPR